MTWQPIETAPKDGDEIWAFNGEQARMKWTEGDEWALWVWADELLSEVDPSPTQPSYWMPLPPPPAVASCPHCNGSGESRKSLGGDTGEHEELGDCPSCDGKGAQLAASVEPVVRVVTSVPHLRSVVVEAIPGADIPPQDALLYTAPAAAQAQPVAYAKQHADVAAQLLMDAHAKAPETWRGWYDDALTHIDIARRALAAQDASKPAQDEREAFEQTFSHLPMQTLLSEGLAAFKNPKAQGAWEGWQARAAFSTPQVDGLNLHHYGDVLRPFVQMMADELLSNRSKGDRPAWMSMHADALMLEIYYHAAKLQKAMKDGSGDDIREYSADVANLCMMVLDVCGGIDTAIAAMSKGEA